MPFDREDQGFAAELVHDVDFYEKLRAIAILKGADSIEAYSAEDAVQSTLEWMVANPHRHAGAVVLRLKEFIQRARIMQEVRERHLDLFDLYEIDQGDHGLTPTELAVELLRNRS